MKRLLIALMCLCVFTGCSSKKEKPKKQEIRQEVKEETVDYTGTWRGVKYIDANGQEFLAEDESWVSENAVFILKKDNSCYLSVGNESTMANWGLANDGIIVGNAKMPYEDGQLVLENNDQCLYFEKTSESEEFPDAEEPIVEEKAEVVEEPAKEEPAVEESQSSGLRPEFKEAMDAYEKFYSDYCEFMKQYSKNPTDLTLLAKYATMITDLDKMDKKFEAWKSEDLNTEELAYYIEVNARIQKLMLEALQ